MSYGGSKKISKLQLEKMADFMEKHPKLIGEKGFPKVHRANLWEELAELLNAVEGSCKTEAKWRRSLKDYKFYLKKKYQTYMDDLNPPTPCPITPMESRFLRLMGYEDIKGVEVEEFFDPDATAIEEEDEDENLGFNITPEIPEESQKLCQAPNFIKLRTNKSDAKSVENKPTNEQTPGVKRSYGGNKRISKVQMEIMLNFMEKHPKLIGEKSLPRPHRANLWEELAELLNSVSEGSWKTEEKWRKSLQDYKWYLKNKYQTYMSELNPSAPCPISHVEARFLRLMGYENIKGVEGEEFFDPDATAIAEEDKDENLGFKITPEIQEESQKCYQVPNIIKLRTNKSDAETSPVENKPTEEQSPSVKISTDKNLDSAPSRSSFGSSTAEALHAIAKELSVKNGLTKRKIELEEERLLLEKRKVEAFELIAKRLHTPSD